MAEPYRPVAPVDPTNLRPMMFLDVAREMILSPDWALPLERMVKESPSTPFDVPMHPRAAAVWREHGYLP